MKNTFATILFLLLGTLTGFAQGDFLKEINYEIDQIQFNIDEYDGNMDGKVTLQSVKQSSEASKLYLDKIDLVQKNINKAPVSDLDKKRRLQDLKKMLKKVRKKNYYIYASVNQAFDLIIKIQTLTDKKRIETILKANIITAIKIIAFYDDQPYAESVLLFASQIIPGKVLKKYKDYSYRDYSGKVLNELAHYAPMNLTYYLGNNNPVFLGIKNANKEQYTKLFLSIYDEVGSNSRAYLLIDEISKKIISPYEAHLLSRDREKLFTHLLNLRINDTILGSFSVNDELTYLSLLKIKRINELHEKPEKTRFEVIDTLKLTAQQIYTLIVYGEDEIFTSSFLGLYKRLTNKITEKNNLKFLHSLGMNKYRTFIKMCANYNTLSSFLASMSDWEKNLLFSRFVSGLQKEINPLEQAVSIADTYGALKSKKNEEAFKENIKKAYNKVKGSNSEAEKLYILLMELFLINSNNSLLSADIQKMSTLMNQDLFHNEINIQQHFFFDDDDGKASFNTFIQTFRKPGWKIVKHQHYYLVESTIGKKVKIYANTSKGEYDGQPQIRELFLDDGHFPDIVVHRGHSYYVEATIKSLTPNTNLVIMGSCGGYNNIAKVLNYAPETQIITSKQVGTLWVNNQMVFIISEYLRLGKDLNWEVLWAELGKKIPSGQARNRFKDYQPPHKNMGAILIKKYRAML